MWSVLSLAWSNALAVPSCSKEDFDAFLMSLRGTKGRISLEVEPSQTVWRVGETVRIRVTSPTDGRLTLVTVDANDVVTPLFPTQGQDDRVEAGKVVEVPRSPAAVDLVTLPPLGDSQLLAIVRPTDRDLPLSCLSPLTKGGEIRLATTVATPAPSRRLPGWGFEAFAYRVVAAPTATAGPR